MPLAIEIAALLLAAYALGLGLGWLAFARTPRRKDDT